MLSLFLSHINLEEQNRNVFNQMFALHYFMDSSVNRKPSISQKMIFLMDWSLNFLYWHVNLDCEVIEC
jgi:hypothetical protein